MNTLREALQDYLALRRGLGYKMHDAGLLLPRFVSFLEECQAKHITARLALEWVQQAQTVQPAERARRLCFVRGFARYRSAVDAQTEIPPVALLPYRSTRARPYLYSEQEVQGLLEAALKLPAPRRTSALRPWVFHCLLGLLSVTGLRISEALDLKRPVSRAGSTNLVGTSGPRAHLAGGANRTTVVRADGPSAGGSARRNRSACTRGRQGAQGAVHTAEQEHPGSPCCLAQRTPPGHGSAIVPECARRTIECARRALPIGEARRRGCRSLPVAEAQAREPSRASPHDRDGSVAGRKRAGCDCAVARP